MNYYDILFARKMAGGQGEITTEGLSVTENGTYTAPEGKAYTPVVVNVPTPEDSYQLKSLPIGAISTITDGSNLPMPSLKVGIEPIQEGSGDPSPENVRPISGWDECKVTVADDVETPTVSNVYTIDLDGTRYGGELDVVNGVLTVDNVYYQFNSSQTYSVTGSVRLSDRWITNITNIPNVSDKIKNRSGVISSISPRDAELASITISGFCKNLASPYPIISLNDSDSGLTESSSATDIVNAVNTFLHQHTPQIVYELATPQTYQLTPTMVKSLLGTNNIWADTGDVLEGSYFKEL